MNRADRLGEGGDRRRGLIVGFALAALQRRLASSPHAIYRSIQRRGERLKKRLAELETVLDEAAAPKIAAPSLPAGLSVADLEDFDADDYGDTELEELGRLRH